MVTQRGGGTISFRQHNRVGVWKMTDKGMIPSTDFVVNIQQSRKVKAAGGNEC